MNEIDDPGQVLLPNWDPHGDQNLEEILKRHLPWITSYVHGKLGHFHRAKADTGDIVQEALIQFLTHGPRLKLTNDGQLRALLCRIVKNVVCGQYAWFTAQRRTMAKERPLPADSVLNLDPPDKRQETPSQISQKHEQEAWARLGIELLESKQREVLILYYWKDLTFAEIGKILSISTVAARKRYLRALYLVNEIIRKLQEGRIDEVLEEIPEEGTGP